MLRVCVRWCLVVYGVKSVRLYFSTDQSRASCRWSTFSKPANSIDLHGSRWSSHSLSLSKSPSKSYRGNLLRKSIAALLIHSVASRTQSSDDKSFDGNYVGEEAGRLFSGPQSLLRLFKDCKCITLCRGVSEGWFQHSSSVCETMSGVSLSFSEPSREAKRGPENKHGTAHRFHTEARVLIKHAVGANPF